MIFRIALDGSDLAANKILSGDHVTTREKSFDPAKKFADDLDQAGAMVYHASRVSFPMCRVGRRFRHYSIRVTCLDNVRTVP